MKELHMGRPAVIDGTERPLHVHSGRDTPDMTKTHGGGGLIHAHLGKPPRRPAEGAEGTVRGHLDDSASVARARAEADEPVMREIAWPVLDAAHDVEDRLHRRAHD